MPAALSLERLPLHFLSGGLNPCRLFARGGQQSLPRVGELIIGVYGGQRLLDGDCREALDGRNHNSWRVLSTVGISIVPTVV